MYVRVLYLIIVTGNFEYSIGEPTYNNNQISYRYTFLIRKSDSNFNHVNVRAFNDQDIPRARPT